MRLLFCSSIYNMDDYEHLAEQSRESLSLADHNLNHNLILGLEEVTRRPVDLINNVPIPNYPHYPKVFFFRQPWSHAAMAKDINCGFINLPILKHLSRTMTTFWTLQDAIRKEKKETICILSYDLHFGISLAVRWVKRLFPSVYTCVVMPDLPNMVVSVLGQGENSVKYHVFSAIKMRFISQFDSYILLTEQMRMLPIFSGKPSVVVEGIYNNHQERFSKEETDKKIILYSGNLNPLYGIENLLEAFLKIYQIDQDYELWVCGGGGLEPQIRALAKDVPGIRYFGYVNGETVRRYQAQATVLVNPRQNNDTFSRYAFPSKTMEYLASGCPVVGYKLDGIPEEYDRYIQYVEGDSVMDLRNKIIEVCSMPKEQREALGERARTFILQEKNPKKQCRKILEMLAGMQQTKTGD